MPISKSEHQEIPGMEAKRHILCVDDDDDTCFMLTTLLGRQGYEAKSVATADEAIRLAGTRQFDLYILDSWLANVRGVEVCKRIREADPQKPIIFYTGAVFPADRADGLSCGAEAYIAKPYLEELIGAIQRLL